MNSTTDERLALLACEVEALDAFCTERGVRFRACHVADAVLDGHGWAFEGLLGAEVEAMAQDVLDAWEPWRDRPEAVGVALALHRELTRHREESR